MDVFEYWVMNHNKPFKSNKHLFFMKKALTFIMLGLFVISMVSATSAMTIVAGVVYDDEGIVVDGAEISVMCNLNEINATSLSDGSYAVEYLENLCDTGDEVTVTATADEGYGVGSGVVMDKGLYPGVDINLSIINVVVPEFGLVIGLMTLLASAGIFFMVRKD